MNLLPRFRRIGVSAICFCNALGLFVCLCWFAVAVPRSGAADEPSVHQTVPQASVNPHPIRWPIIDGTDTRFTRLSTAGGRSLTKVAAIVQDDQGFMWFGTQYGLNRFDGYTFKVFMSDPGNSNSLSGVFISALFKDRDGTLWVGCEQFLNRFERTTETFTRYPIPFVINISQDTRGVLWFATATGLYGLDPATSKIRHYTHDSNDPASLSSDDVQFSGEDREGRFWVANSEGLDEFDRGTGKVALHIPLHEPSSGFSFYEDRSGLFWIYHLSPNALALFDRGTNTLTHFSFGKRKPPTTEVTGVSAMLEDRDGTLWLATHGAGLLKFDREHRRFIRYRNDPGDPESLPQNNVESLFADREGSIWAGLGRMGLARFGRSPPPFQRFPHLDSPNNTVQPFVGAIYEDHQGILWIGTPAALNRIDRNPRRYTYYHRATGPAATTDVITIREDRSDNLWVGTYGHGLLRFDRRTGRFKTYQFHQADPYSLSSDIIMSLLVDHNGTLWAASSNGLSRFDAETERFTTYKLDTSRNPFYLALVEDREGALWLGTKSSGLYRFDPATGKLAIYEHTENQPGTLSDNRVNSVHFDRSGTMWVGTQNGLNRFDSKKGSFVVYARRDGLPGNAVGCILEDDGGNLWMGTNNGVARFNPQSRTFQSYSTPEGLPGADLTGWSAGFRSASGEMFFGGFSGAAAFFPDKVTETRYTPPIVLTDFQLSATSAEYEGRSFLPRSISYTSDLVLSHNQNIFSLTFAALSYANPATNRYRYKLEGLQQDWSEVGSDRRQVTYTTLPAGDYRFRVQGATSRGMWSEPGVSLRIQILPPWWGTWWFRVICISGAGVLLWMLYLLRLRHATAEIQARLGERLVERERIARELHDTLLQGFSGLALRFQAVLKQIPVNGPAREMMEAALDRVDDVLLEGRDRVRELRGEGLTGNQLPDDLARYGVELAPDHAARFSLSVVGTPNTLDPTVCNEAYWIGREGIANAFQHAKASKIEAEVTYSSSGVSIRIRDDGSGMDDAMLQEGRTGHWGLSGMRERAQKIGAKLSVWSRAGKGTEIDLWIPANLAYPRSRKAAPWHRIRFAETAAKEDTKRDQKDQSSGGRRSSPSARGNRGGHSGRG